MSPFSTPPGCAFVWLQQAVTGSGKIEKKNFAITDDSDSAAGLKVKSTRGIKWIGLVGSKKFALPLGHK